MTGRFMSAPSAAHREAVRQIQQMRENPDIEADIAFAAAAVAPWQESWRDHLSGVWRPSRGQQCAAKPGRVKHRHVFGEPPCAAPKDDHGSLWFNGKDYRYVYHPYSFPDVRELADYVEEWQLRLTVSPRSWYYPTQTILIQLDRPWRPDEL